MLSSATVSKTFWAKAVTIACFLINRCPSTTMNMKTPEEVWSGHPLTYDRLRVFGCVAYAHIRQDKLEPRALKSMFIRYPEGVKGYKLWCLEDGHKKCIISRDVVFNEFEMAHKIASNTNKGQLDPALEKAMLEVEPTDTARVNKMTTYHLRKSV